MVNVTGGGVDDEFGVLLAEAKRCARATGEVLDELLRLRLQASYTATVGEAAELNDSVQAVLDRIPAEALRPKRTSG